MLCTWTFASPWMWFPVVSLEWIVDICTEDVDDAMHGKFAGRSGSNSINGTKSSENPAASLRDQQNFTKDH